MIGLLTEMNSRPAVLERFLLSSRLSRFCSSGSCSGILGNVFVY